MSYVSANLVLMSQSGGPVGRKFWTYDTTDAVGDIDAAGYISDAAERGMEKGDMVHVVVWTSAVPDTTAKKQTAAGTATVIADAAWFIVMGLSTAGAADLANETAITVSNSD